jgi:hypothetical protein
MRKSTILFITIIILIITSILGLFIGSLILKQVKFNREILYSGIAIAAADAGIEKALYLMVNNQLTSTCNLSFSNWEALDNGASFCIDYEGDVSNPEKLESKGYFRGVYRALEIYFE